MKRLLGILALIALFAGAAVVPAKAFPSTIFPPYEIEVVVAQNGIWRGWYPSMGVDDLDYIALRSKYTVWTPGIIQNGPSGYQEAYNEWTTGHISTFADIDNWSLSNCQVINLTQVRCTGLIRSALFTCPATMAIASRIMQANDHHNGPWMDGSPWFIVPSAGGPATQPYVTVASHPSYTGSPTGIRISCSYVAPPVYVTF